MARRRLADMEIVLRMPEGTSKVLTMPEVKARLREYGSAISVMSAYAVLATVWVMIFLVFLGHMLPPVRDILRHSPAG